MSIKNDLLYDLLAASGNPNGWESKIHQEENFCRLPRLANFCGERLREKSVLDIGCGTGQLLTFLESYSPRDYLGVDIYAPSLSIARKEHPKNRFKLFNVLKEDLREKFDYIFCSGALSTRLGENSEVNETFLEAMVQRINKYCITGAYFNYLSNTAKEQDPDLFYYDDNKVLELSNSIIDDKREIAFKKDRTRDESHIYLIKKCRFQ
ncbi:class I SAM-dependent methyltransferase [Candidatus Woesearchaeota archaeon]|nr:class I SAM-dependent methyltransferase [Candidatus Woesearchaeota archaeon]